MPNRSSGQIKTGGLIVALCVLIVLGGLVWWFNKHPSVDKSTANTPAAPKLISADPKQIEEIRLAKSGSDPVEITKLANSWTISKPSAMPADSDAVDMLAGSLATLNADRVIDEHPSDLNAFGLTNPSEEIDVTVKGGRLIKLLLGSDTPSSTGTYAKIESDPKVYTVPTYTKTSFDKSVNDLRDKRLLTFNQDKLTSVVITGKGQRVEFGRNAQGDWQIAKPKPMRADSLQVDDLIRKLKGAKMDLTSANAEPKDAAAQFASGEKAGTASTIDNTGSQTVEVRRGKDNSYYAKSTAVAGIYKVAGEIGDALGKTADDYRNRKLFDFGFNDPTKLDINGTLYQKSGDTWKSGSTPYEAGTVQSVIDKLRDLSATKFADRMNGTPALTIALTAGDNHRKEKVTINADGAVYAAQREGEPAVYILDPKLVDDLQKAISGIKKQAPAPGKK
ncbi:MAG: DUF4340 domain-containing protein [Acidobacteriota bacterium]|nr:DUF4340 domain-containing protein [Acidobacteriota bacterium]